MVKDLFPPFAVKGVLPPLNVQRYISIFGYKRFIPILVRPKVCSRLVVKVGFHFWIFKGTSLPYLQRVLSHPWMPEVCSHLWVVYDQMYKALFAIKSLECILYHPMFTSMSTKIINHECLNKWVFRKSYAVLARTW